MLSEIWRYPVKSCAGEALREVDVGSAGLIGDRAWAVVDRETGFVASVKRPSLWRDLLSLKATGTGERVRLALPNGETCSTQDLTSLEQRLSSLLGRSVALKRAGEINSPMLERTDPDVDALLDDGTLTVGETATGPLATASPPGTVFDFAPIHLISTPTLEALEAAGEPTAGDLRRFRPNLVVDVDGPAFQENDWPGHRLAVGPELVLDVLIPTPRCIVPSLAQSGLPKSASTLRAVASLNRIELDGRGASACAGVYATVHHGGSAVVGADVSVTLGAA